MVFDGALTDAEIEGDILARVGVGIVGGQAREQVGGREVVERRARLRVARKAGEIERQQPNALDRRRARPIVA